MRGALLVTSGRIAWMSRPPVEATALLLDGAALLELEDRAEAVSALSDAFRATLASGSVATSIVERILGLVDRAEPTERVLADLVSGISLVQLGRLDEGERVLRGLLAEPDTVGPASRLQDAGVIAAMWLYDYPRALEEAARAIESARSAGHLSRLPQLLQIQGFCEARSGHFAAAYAAVAEAVSLAEELGQVVVWSDAVNTLAGLEARLGLHDRCHEHAALAIDRCAALGLDWFRGHALLNLALSDLALGRCGQAVGLVEDGHALLRSMGVRDPDEFAYETLVEALVQLGRDDAAAGAVAEMEALFAAVGRASTIRSPSGARRSSRRTAMPPGSLNAQSHSTPSTTRRSSLPAHISSLASGFVGWVSGVGPATSYGLRWSSSSGSVPTGGPSGAAGSWPRAERACGS